MALTKVPSNLDATIATTQSASDNSTNVATTAYVTTAIANLVDGAPSTLNTLDEIAAALNDDAALNTTLTNSIATKLPLAGGTLTGALNMGSQNITNAGAGDFAGVVGAGNLEVGGGNSSASIYRTGSDGSGFHFTTNAIYPADQTGAVSDATEDLGNGSYRYKDLYLSGNITTNGAIKVVGDNLKLEIGSASGGDLQLYHDGSNSYIKNNTGWLNMPMGGNGVSIANSDFSKILAKFLVNGAAELYHNGSKKLETTSGGVIVTGTLNADTVSAGFTSTLKGYFYEDTLDQNGSGKPTSVLGIAAAGNHVGEGPSIDFNNIWAQSAVYQQDNWNEGWTLGRIGAVYDSSVGNGGALVFYTHSGTTASGGAGNAQVSEKVRIDPNGYVGIGTESPSDILDIHDSHSQLRLTDSDDSKFVQFSYSGGKLITRNNSANTTANQVTLTEDGKFGIGEINPDATVTIGASHGYVQEWKNAKGFKQNSTGQSGANGNYNESTYINVVSYRGVLVDYYESGHYYNNGAAYYFRHSKIYVIMEGSTLRVADVVLERSTGNVTGAIVNAPSINATGAGQFTITSTILSGYTHYVSVDAVGAGFVSIGSIG